MPDIAHAMIAEPAHGAGVDVALIRLYEKIGLLPKSRCRRGRSGDAAYHQEHYDRLMFIKRAFGPGLSLGAIAELAGVNGGQRTCNDVYRIVEHNLADLRRRIDELTQMEGRLRSLVAAYPRKDSRSDCVILTKLSRPIC